MVVPLASFLDVGLPILSALLAVVALAVGAFGVAEAGAGIAVGASGSGGAGGPAGVSVTGDTVARMPCDVSHMTASAPASTEPSVTLTNLSGNTVYIIRVWAVNEAGAGPAAEVMGQTGAVSPGLCGTARAATEGEEQALVLEWEPPSDNGGADLVAYRVWLRPVFQDGLGGFFPASNYIDLGLFEHVGEATATQKAPVKFGAQLGCHGHGMPWDVMGCHGMSWDFFFPAPFLMKVSAGLFIANRCNGPAVGDL
eukprot:s1999_g19.t1